MSRRSTRIKQLHEEKPAITQPRPTKRARSVATGTAEPDAGAPHRKRSRTKKSTPTRVRKAGNFRQMLDMPLDVILEICAYLLPIDVLQLSRTSKDLRGFFLSRDSISIWKAAMSNLPGLPPCPDDLSEPAYINLMFSLRCHVCFKRNSQDVYWLLRLRLCDTCRKQNEIADWNIESNIEAAVQPRKLFNLVPPLRFLYGCDKYPYYYKPALEEFTEDFKKTRGAKRKEFLRSREKLIASREEVSNLVPCWIRTFYVEGHSLMTWWGSPSVRDVCPPLVQKDLYDILARHGLIERWQGSHELLNYLESSKASLKKDFERQKIARRDQIVERLKQAGYEQEVDFLCTRHGRKAYYGKLDAHPDVWKSQALTARIWNNIQGRIFTFMDEVRENRLRDSRRKTLLERLNALDKYIKAHCEEFSPRVVYGLEVACSIPEVVRFLDPHNDEFDSRGLERVVDGTIAAYMEDREKRYRQALRALIKTRLDLDESVDPLDLAVAATFHCNTCRRNFTLIHALQHICGGSRSDYLYLARCEGMSDEYHDDLKEWARRRGIYWRAPSWRQFEHGFWIAAKVVRECGLDPKTASASDMDAINARFLCPDHRYYAPVMDWRAMIQHRSDCYGDFRRATAAEVSAATPLEAALERERAEATTYRCGHCNGFRNATKEAVGVHLREVHDVAEPKEENCMDLRDKLPPADEVRLFLPQEKVEHHYMAKEDSKKALERGVGAYFDYSDVKGN